MRKAAESRPGGASWCQPSRVRGTRSLWELVVAPTARREYPRHETHDILVGMDLDTREDPTVPERDVVHARPAWALVDGNLLHSLELDDCSVERGLTLHEVEVLCAVRVGQQSETQVVYRSVHTRSLVDGLSILIQHIVLLVNIDPTDQK